MGAHQAAQFRQATNFIADTRRRILGTDKAGIDQVCPLNGDCISRYAGKINHLVREGFLLEADAGLLKTRAAESEVGKPCNCD